VAPVRVAAARLRSRPGRALLLLTGIGAAFGMFVAVLGGTVIARDLSLQRMVARLPAADRSFRVDLVGLPAGENHARTDATARRALAELTHAEPLRVVAFRDFWLDGEFVRVSGMDGQHDAVRLLSGRFPRRCDARVCEVLEIGPRGKRDLSEGDITLRRVGVAELVDPARFGPAFTRLRQLRAQGSWITSTILLAPSGRALERLPTLELFYRLASWVVPLDRADVHEWQIADVLRRESRAHAILERADPAFNLVGPDSALLEAGVRGHAYARRMVLIGGSVGVALFGFAIIAAAGLRRGIAAERRRLSQRGATAGQLALALLAEVGTIAVAGAIVGVAAGVTAIAAITADRGLPIGATLAHALLHLKAALILAVTLFAAVALVAWGLSGQDRDARRGRVRPLDVAFAGAVLAVAIGLSRGAVTPESGGDTTFLVLLPALICLAAGLVTARVLGPAMIGAERLGRRGPIALRLALLALARAPARTAAAAAFLVVAIGLIIFAATYRSTLDHVARDTAAFAVPMDFALSAGPNLLQPLDAAPVERYERLARGARAYPVLRVTADAVGVGTSVRSVTVLGVPSQALATLKWRSDFSETPRSRMVKSLSADGSMALNGVEIPARANALRVQVRLDGAPLSLELVTRDARGRVARISLGTVGRGRSTLTTRLAAGSPSRPTELLGLELSLSRSGRAWLLHLAREGRAVRAPAGRLSVQPLTAVGAGRERTLTDWRGWITRGGRAAVERRGHSDVEIRYRFPEAEPLLLRLRQPTDGRVLRVVASSSVAATAARGGLLTLNFYTPRVQARVIAAARYFPTIAEDEAFVVADEAAVATALDADAPGTGTPGELWLDVADRDQDSVRRALGRPPFSRLQRLSRQGLYEQARADPLAEGVANTLGVGALVALVLAVVGLWATVANDVRDEQDTFFDLEAQGVGPGALRRHMRIRTGALLTFGVAGGVALGIVLSRLVVPVVQVTATGTHAYPPLVAATGLAPVGAALAILVALCALAGEATLHQAFRADVPQRGSWSVE
jgi:hypothetical protein